MSRPSSRAGHGRGTSSRRVIVSLEFLPANTSVQTPITNEFSSHLPLSDLQWKSSSRSTTRTIESLSLDFKSFQETARDAQPQQIPINLLERPYLHLMFVASDDNEAYRITLRPQIREWLNVVQSKKQQEWLIVHVTSQKTGPARFYQRKGSVFDKIRADFNLSKRDRVLQLPLPGSQADEGATDYTAIWREFLAKAKESIVLSFDGNFTSYEEDVRKIDAQRQMPGWNFCTFFIQKEGLAHSFEAMNLLEDALIQYDELEASYYLGAKDQTLPWFSRIGGNMQNDDGLSILSSQTKDYRHLIMQNNISIFDFRIYLFSRQATLIIGLGRIVDLAKRAKFFIYSMTKLLRSHHGVLKRYFIESWIYTASLEVVDKCNQLLNARKMNAAAIPDLLPIIAELLELAIRQVEKLGMIFGYLPRAHPFLMSMQSSPLDELDGKEDGLHHTQNSNTVAFESSNAQLQDSFRDQEAFDELYRDLLDRVHEAWNGSMRMRNANKIKGTLAALEQARKQTKRALDIYSSLAGDFSRTHWTSIESQILRQAAALRENATDRREQTERLLAVLALVRIGLQTGSLRWALGSTSTDGADMASQFLTEARVLSQTLEKDFAVVDVPAFSVSLNRALGDTLSEEDGISVSVVVMNYLPCALEVDEIRLKFNSNANDPLWLKSGPVTLRPGKSSLKTTAPVTLVGTYALETSQIRTSRLVFQRSHKDLASGLRTDASDFRTPLAAGKQPLIIFTQDRDALDVSAEDVPDMSLDRPRALILALRKGRQPLKKAVIRFPDTVDKIAFLFETLQVLEGDCLVDTNSQDRSMTLSFTGEDTSSRLSIEFHSLTQAQHVYLPVHVEYYAAHRPENRRLLKTCIRVRTALPLDVAVHDYRRETFLLSKFTVSTGQPLPLRIKSANLKTTARFRVVAACKDRARPVIVKRDQHGSFPFRLERKKMDDNTIDENAASSSRLHIKFTYRTLEDDLQTILSSHLSNTFLKHDTALSPRLAQAIVSQLLLDECVQRHFNKLEVVDTLGREDITFTFDDIDKRLRYCKRQLRSYWTSDDEWDRIELAIREAVQTPIPTGLLANQAWNTVTIPFDVPPLAIFNRVSLSPLLDPKQPVQVGQPVSSTLHIRSSFDWATPAEKQNLQRLCNNSENQSNVHGQGQRMLFEIQLKEDEWVISGHTRGEFYISTPDKSHVDFPLTLIPLKAGELYLPSISVHPLPALEAAIEAHEQNRQLSYDNLPTCETYQEDAAAYVEVAEQAATRSDFQLSTVTGEVFYPAVTS